MKSIFLTLAVLVISPICATSVYAGAWPPSTFETYKGKYELYNCKGQNSEALTPNLLKANKLEIDGFMNEGWIDLNFFSSTDLVASHDLQSFDYFVSRAHYKNRIHYQGYFDGNKNDPTYTETTYTELSLDSGEPSIGDVGVTETITLAKTFNGLELGWKRTSKAHVENASYFCYLRKLN